MVKIARLTLLRRRLNEVLEDQPELAATFERALIHHDESALGEAFEVLHRAPDRVRKAVEAAIVDWLFGSEGEVHLANLMPGRSSEAVH